MFLPAAAGRSYDTTWELVPILVFQDPQTPQLCIVMLHRVKKGVCMSATDAPYTPTISVIIPTKGTAASLASCVQSILNERVVQFELIVANQGDRSSVEHALGPFAADTRLRILHTPTRGISGARNAGAAAARGSLLAFTDDDCAATDRWLAALLACLERHPRAGIVFGRVSTPVYDRSLFTIPAYEPPETDQEWDRLVPFGVLGANMGVRRTAYDDVRGFDDLLALLWRDRRPERGYQRERHPGLGTSANLAHLVKTEHAKAVLGAGAPLSAGEDYDFAVRLLSAGYTVVCSGRADVVHYGQRNRAQERRMWMRDGYGVGGLVAKQFRLGNVACVRYLSVYFAKFPYYAVVNPLRGRPSLPPRMIATLYSSMARGFLAGLRLPLAPDTHYGPVPGQQLGPTIDDRAE